MSQTLLYRSCVAFDASDFHDGWSGTIECRFRTPRAGLYLERLSR